MIQFEKENLQRSARGRVRILVNYFIKGLLILIPLVLTFVLLHSTVVWVETTAEEIIPIDIPGMGILIVVGAITLLGYVGSRLFFSNLLDLLDDLLSKIPFIKIVYTSVKDFVEAFVGDKKKFTEPVMVEVSSSGVCKIGFVTQKDMSKIGVDGYMAVYFPLSYALTGEMYLVPSHKVKPIKANAAELMKFIVSGGITEIDNKENRPNE
jgi:uncharacterized membrane protein